MSHVTGHSLPALMGKIGNIYVMVYKTLIAHHSMPTRHTFGRWQEVIKMDLGMKVAVSSEKSLPFFVQTT